MYISPENRDSPNKKTRVSGDSRYGRLITKLKGKDEKDAVYIFETRATIMRTLDSMPRSHYWITRKSDKEGEYWDIQLHPDCANLEPNFLSLNKCLGNNIRFKISIKKLGK